MKYVFLILAVCLFAAIVGCEGVTNYSGTTENCQVWQCISEPDIYVSIVGRVDTLAFCEVIASLDVGTMALPSISLDAMLDSGFKRVADSKPKLGPPPFDWSEATLSDKVKIVRIDGTAQVAVFVFVALPVHDEIGVTDPVPVRE